jgi:methanogenic corrinoid protein MtbC1
MLSDLLETDGWDVMFLGANLPTGDLVRFASQIEPHLVCISVTVPTNLLAARDMVEALREKVTPPPRIMVGGQALSGSPNLCEKIRADACPSTAQEARDLARSWWEETGSS